VGSFCEAWQRQCASVLPERKVPRYRSASRPMEVVVVLAMEVQWAMALWDHPMQGSPKWTAIAWVERRLLSERGGMPVRVLWRRLAHPGNVCPALSPTLSTRPVLLPEEALGYVDGAAWVEASGAGYTVR
jgi:hypothetical protein